MTDAVGVLMLLVGWSAFLVPVIRYRELIELRKTLAGIGLAGAGVVIWSIGTDTVSWWIVGAALLVGVQLAPLSPSQARLQGPPPSAVRSSSS